MRAWQWAVALAGLACAGGCIQRTPVVRLPDATQVAIAFVQDADGAGAARDVPDALKEAVVQELAGRNLVAEVLPFAAVEDAFSRLRTTPRRFDLLKEQTNAPLLLLVETRATFFSQMSGRYRWMVQARLTANLRETTAEATSRGLEEAVLLVFDHQREPAALAAAAPRLAEAAGSLFDDVLATPPPAGAKDTATGTGLRLPGKGAIYFVMVDRFANGDASNDADADPADPAAFHGGDLAGLLARLDELKALGVETVWLSPVFQMRTSKFHGHGAFHGYWVEDLEAVEPRFGDLALLRRLSDELHARGMKLVLDLVLNHVGPDTRLVTEKPQWFNRKGPLTDWKDPVHLEHHDVHGLPDLAVEKEEVYQHLLGASLRWIEEVRPDGFRLDAVKHMPAAFWRRYNADIRKVAGPDFLLLGEMLDGDPEAIARTWAGGDFDALFDFPLHFAVNDVLCRGEPATKLGAILSADRTYPDALRLVTLPDNHDLPRLFETCGRDLEKVKQALLFTLTARGTPSLTWGTESAQPGATEPGNRASMRFDHQPLRPFISTVLAARAKSAALRTGVPLLLDVGPDRFVQARVEAGSAAVVAVNRGPSPLTVQLPGPLQHVAFRDVVDGKAQKGALTVPPGGVRVWVGEAGTPTALARLRELALATWKGTAPPREVSFSVTGAPASGKDVLHVVGSAPELGGWDTGRAPVVERGHVVTRLPPGAVTEFKLVVRRNGALQWEAGENRALVVPGGDAPLVIPVEWRANP